MTTASTSSTRYFDETIPTQAAYHGCQTTGSQRYHWITVQGEIDIYTIGVLRDALDKVINKYKVGDKIVIFAGIATLDTGLILPDGQICTNQGVTYMDGSGFGTLARTIKFLRSNGQTGQDLLLITPNNGPLRRFLAVAKLDQHIRFLESASEIN